MTAARLKLALVGASGRMGQAILRLAEEAGDIDVVARASEGDSLEAACAAGAHVAIDFSSPAATRAFVALAAKARLPVVVGTTGLGEDDRLALSAAAASTPLFVSSNMSVGVYVLGALLERALVMLGPDFDVEIVEAHHRRKVDAPSGTAMTLLDVARKTRAGSEASFGRSGRPGARPAAEIGVLAMRGGDVVGDHHVHLLGDGERLELTHRASNRDVFAHGALRAARFLAHGRSPGLYGMKDLFA